MPATAASSKFDPAKADTFAENLLKSLNYGSLPLMVSIGHRTGLFDAMNGLAPAGSEEIAKRAGLNERYVREWLEAKWGEAKAREYLKTAGFRVIETHQLDHDIQNNWYVVRK